MGLFGEFASTECISLASLRIFQRKVRREKSKRVEKKYSQPRDLGSVRKSRVIKIPCAETQSLEIVFQFVSPGPVRKKEISRRVDFLEFIARNVTPSFYRSGKNCFHKPFLAFNRATLFVHSVSLCHFLTARSNASV